MPGANRRNPVLALLLLAACIGGEDPKTDQGALGHACLEGGTCLEPYVCLEVAEGSACGLEGDCDGTDLVAVDGGCLPRCNDDAQCEGGYCHAALEVCVYE